MSTANPVRPQSRLAFVDIIRGFALIGVLAANMSSFSGYNTAPDAYTDFLDKAILIGLQFFVRAKFYSLFSFLFGWGMAVQMLRAADKGVRFGPIFARRMAILLIFGLIHGMLIWHGDILTLYATLGFALLLFRRRSERALLIAAALFLLLTIILAWPGELMEVFRSWYSDLTAFMREGTLPDSIFATGSFWEIVPKTTQEFWAGQSWVIYYVGNVFSMFLLGLYVGKRQIMQQVDDHLPLIKRTLLIGLVIGVLFNAIFVWNTLHPDWVDPRYSRLVSAGSRTIGAPALMLFYVSGLILLTRRAIWLERLRPLGNLGRMALSNYLMQSIICVFIFYGFGLGLYGQTDPSFGLIVTVLILLAQIRFSGWYLARFQFGPMEWLWRTLTYGKRQPWRIAGGDAPAASSERRGLGAWRRSHPLAGLGIVWILIALWAAGLLYWYHDLGNDAGLSLQLAARPTATPAATMEPNLDGQADGPAVAATPQVEAVAYHPGAIARSGDMVGLAQAFEVDRAFEQIENLSGSPYDGRRAGSTGGLAAGAYLAEQFSLLGLQPAGDEGSFFQSFPISYTNLVEAPQFTLTLPDGVRGDGYQPYQDYAPVIREFTGDGSGRGDVVWMNRCTHEDFGHINAAGKVALCQLDSERASLIEASRNAAEHGAAGLLLATDPLERPADMGSSYLLPWIPEPIPALLVYPRLVDDLFLDSGSTITESLLLDEPLALATHADLAVATLGSEACPAANGVDGCTGRNVLGVLPGRDPEFADEVVIIGAHYDHLGNSPVDGAERVVWAGANDNASGAAALLEIARTWREEGYVPRRTVLFAAWDAEELGLLGSIHYVRHPQYPLENTVGMLQLDMVGAGGDYLNIDGSDALIAQMQAVAKDMDISLHQIRMGRSDHLPFLEARVPAAMLIWLDESGGTPSHYHRPSDTPEVIDLDKLEQVGELAALTALNLAESEPAILALLANRAAAAAGDDQPAFLATSSTGQRDVDGSWFVDLQAHRPLSVTLSADNLQISGDRATAETSISVVYPLSDTLRTVEGSLPARFTRSDAGWLWDGPDLDAISGDGVTVRYPAGLEQSFTEWPRVLRERYGDIAKTLGLPENTPFELQLFADEEALRSSTALFLPEEQDYWIGPGMVRITGDGEVWGEGDEAQRFEVALVRLALAQGGVEPEDARWLWDGLPLAWQARSDPVSVQAATLPLLQEALANDLPVPAKTAAWAETTYALERAGWEGVFNYTRVDTWRDAWRARLAVVQSDLDALMARRTAAILARDEAAFLDTAVPELLAAQRRWLADLDAYPLTSFSQTAAPLAILEDGAVLAQVTMAYELDGGEPSTAEMAILFKPDERGYLWAGKRLHELPGAIATVRYPDGYEERAKAIQEKAAAWAPEIASMVALSPTLPLEIELYDGPDDMRAAIALPYAATNWTESGQAIKLQANAGDDGLVNQLGRQLLLQAGTRDEWLLRGVPAFLSAHFDDGVTQQKLAAVWPELLKAAAEETLPELADMASQVELSPGEDQLAEAAAWDAVRTYVHAHGWAALAEQIAGREELVAVDTFQDEWAASLKTGHIRPEWLAVVSAFDAQAAMATVDELAGPELAGRLAGTPGAERAADTIAEAFRAAGLQPAGEEGTYFQTVPITTSQIIAPIRLELNTAAAGSDPFVYREDFLPLYPTEGGEPIVGPVYFVQKEADYEGIDFEGAIVVRWPELPAAEELRKAEEHGAGGLILTGVKREDVDLYGKRPDALLETAAIPVLELTQSGTAKMLTALELDRAALKRLEPVQALEAEALMYFAVTAPEPATTRNVLAVLPGSDPLLGRETIILGTHYDYVGDDGDGRRYGGANEATGAAALVELARMWQEAGYEPQRTILFAAWGGQELGNAGSQAYAAEPTRPLPDTIALVQLEGIGGGKGIALGAQGEEGRDGWLLSGLETAAAQLGGKVVLTPITTSSDQDSFAEQGFPTLLVSWRLAGDDNLSSDAGYAVSPENIEFSGQSAALLLMSLAQ